MDNHLEYRLYTKKFKCGIHIQWELGFNSSNTVTDGYEEKQRDEGS